VQIVGPDPVDHDEHIGLSAEKRKSHGRYRKTGQYGEKRASRYYTRGERAEVNGDDNWIADDQENIRGSWQNPFSKSPLKNQENKVEPDGPFS